MKKTKEQKRWLAVIGAGVFGMSALLSCTSCIFLPGTRTETKISTYKKTYTVQELKQIEANSFKKLNEVSYPDAFRRTVYPVSEEYRAAMYDFALNVYRHRGEDKNFSFSPLGLYTNLSLSALASDNEVALAALDGVLGMTKETRKADFVNMYKTNYFCNENGTVQQYNASFQSNRWGYNRAYTDSLTEHYAEAYQVDFNADAGVNKILEWVDGKTGEKDFLKKDDLAITEDTAMMIFSTLLFDNKWATTYFESNSEEGTFRSATGDQKATFMSHTYLGDCYDYGEYIACYDYYRNGMKIKYLTPKAEDGDIFALTAGADLLRDDEKCKILPPRAAEDEYYREEDLIVHLTMPRFSSECMVDFSEPLKEMGLSYLFEKDNKSFNYAFTGLDEDTSMYLSFVKQKNKVAFSEEGTLIKSVTFAMTGATSAGPMRDGIDIKLDHPFIYVVYDANDLPLYIGNVDRI